MGAIERGARGRASAYYGVDRLIQRRKTGRSSRLEKRDYRGSGKQVGVCKVSPGAYGEGSTGILGLNRVYTKRVSVIEKDRRQKRRCRCEMEA